ncbi:hypothetical protein HDU92_007671, partial [Lobulomyces angularis]
AVLLQTLIVKPMWELYLVFIFFDILKRVFLSRLYALKAGNERKLWKFIFGFIILIIVGFGLLAWTFVYIFWLDMTKPGPTTYASYFILTNLLVDSIYRIVVSILIVKEIRRSIFFVNKNQQKKKMIIHVGSVCVVNVLVSIAAVYQQSYAIMNPFAAKEVTLSGFMLLPLCTSINIVTTFLVTHFTKDLIAPANNTTSETSTNFSKVSMSNCAL